MRHPPHHLPPKPVVIRVLHAAPPAPRGIGAHVEHLAIARGARDEQREAPALVARGLVDGEHFRARLRLHDRRVPVKSRQPAPHRLVRGGVRGEHRQPVVASAKRQLQPGFRAAGETAAFPEIRLHRHEVGERGIGERFLPSERARQQHQSACLLLDQPLDHRRVFGREHPAAHAHIAEENHVVTLQILALRRELLEVARAFTGAEFRVIEHRVHEHAGIAHERVAQIAKLPARLRIHDQHLERFLAHREVEGALVVRGKNLLALDRNAHREVALAFRRRRENDRILHLPHRRQHNGFRAFHIARSLHGDGRFHLARQMILHGEHHADPLFHEPVSRREHGLDFHIREIRFAAHADGENGHVALRIPRRRSDRTLVRFLAEIVIAVAQQQYRAEIGILRQHARQRLRDVRADLGFHIGFRVVGRRLGKGFEADLILLFQRAGKFRGELLLHPLGARERLLVAGQHVLGLHAARGVVEHDHARLFAALFHHHPLRPEQCESDEHRDDQAQHMQDGHSSAAALAVQAAEEKPHRRDDERHRDGDDPRSGVDLPLVDHCSFGARVKFTTAAFPGNSIAVFFPSIVTPRLTTSQSKGRCSSTDCV